MPPAARDPFVGSSRRRVEKKPPTTPADKPFSTKPLLAGWAHPACVASASSSSMRQMPTASPKPLLVGWAQPACVASASSSSLRPTPTASRRTTPAPSPMVRPRTAPTPSPLPSPARPVGRLSIGAAQRAAAAAAVAAALPTPPPAAARTIPPAERLRSVLRRWRLLVVRSTRLPPPHPCAHALYAVAVHAERRRDAVLSERMGIACSRRT